MNEASHQDDRLGMVVSGSLTEGLRVRLDREVSIEEIKVGRYVTVQAMRSAKFLRSRARRHSIPSTV